MNHEMKVTDGQFWKMVDGTKRIEVRLLDEKREQIKLGDTITFTNMKNPEKKIKVNVVGLSHFKSFKALFMSLPCESLGSPSCEVVDQVESMKKFYNLEQRKENDALAIHLNRVE